MSPLKGYSVLQRDSDALADLAACHVLQPVVVLASFETVH